MLILGEVHFLVTEKNRGVTSLQTGYLLIVRFKYTKFSMVALNFWSHGHRVDFACDGVITGWLSGGFHRYLMTLVVQVLALNQASFFISCVIEMLENWLLFFCYVIIQGVGLPGTLAVAVWAA